MSMRWFLEGVTGLGRPPLPRISGNGLILRTPDMADFPAWAALREQSRGFLAPWEPLWPEDDLSRGAYRRRLVRLRKEAAEESGFSFLIFTEETGQLLGGITLSNVRRRAAQTGTLGYWMGEPFARHGFMTKSVRLLSDFAFRTLGLERLEAACLPENVASIRVLEKAGFRREGYARAYLAIAGRRRDHLLYGLLKSDLFPPDSAAP
ncbi:GNAT family N-acetyltransferase [Rhabdaerophilum sp.]|uniref:GNAT family N-acetyltransferase n=1 Tax=Rhabdaerophilum sp. TaxID=2717341 RepID=UPI0038D4FC88